MRFSAPVLAALLSTVAFTSAQEQEIIPTGCSASSEYNTNYNCERVYDESLTSDWATYGQADGNWINLELSAEYPVVSIQFRSRIYSGDRNKELELLFSDGSTQNVELQATNDDQYFEVGKYTSSINVTSLSTYGSSNGNVGYRDIKIMGYGAGDTLAPTPAPTPIRDPKTKMGTHYKFVGTGKCLTAAGESPTRTQTSPRLDGWGAIYDRSIRDGTNWNEDDCYDSCYATYGEGLLAFDTFAYCYCYHGEGDTVRAATEEAWYYECYSTDLSTPAPTQAPTYATELKTGNDGRNTCQDWCVPSVRYGSLGETDYYVCEGGTVNGEEIGCDTAPGAGNAVDCFCSHVDPGAHYELVDLDYSKHSYSGIYANNAIGVSHGSGRLDSSQAWSAWSSNNQQWMKFTLDAPTLIKGVATMARNGASQWVKSYTVSCDDVPVDDGSVFTANVGLDSLVENEFAEVVQCTTVTIHPQSWYGHLSMRAGLIMDVNGASSADGGSACSHKPGHSAGGSTIATFTDCEDDCCCAQHCEDEEACQAWQFVHDGYSNDWGSCYLKPVVIFAADEGSNSGYKEHLHETEVFNTDDASNWDITEGEYIVRHCPTCVATHQTIVYKRLTDGTGVDFKDLMMDNWNIRATDNNEWKVDYNLFSSMEDAAADENAWTYSNGNDPGIGFPRDSGPTGMVGSQWTSSKRIPRKYDEATGATFFKVSIGAYGADTEALVESTVELLATRASAQYGRGATMRNKGMGGANATNASAVRSGRRKKRQRLLLVELDTPTALSEAEMADAGNDVCGEYIALGLETGYDHIGCEVTTTDPDASTARRLLEETYYIEMYGINYVYMVDGETVHKCLDSVCFSNTADNRHRFARDDSVADAVGESGLEADEFSGSTSDGSWAIVDGKIVFSWNDNGDLKFAASCECL